MSDRARSPRPPATFATVRSEHESIFPALPVLAPQNVVSHMSLFSFLGTYQEDRSDGEDESDNERSHMSSKKDFDFSFIGTYRDRSDDESDSDHSHLNPSSSMSEEEDEQECMCHTGADSFELPQSPAAVETPVEGQEDSDDEPSPWKDSKAKKGIIEQLKNDKAAIHSMDPKES